MTQVVIRRELGKGAFGRVCLVQLAPVEVDLTSTDTSSTWMAMKMMSTETKSCITIEQVSEMVTSAILLSDPGLPPGNLSSVCCPRLVIGTGDKIYEFMDYVPYTLKSLRPVLHDIRPAETNEYQNKLDEVQIEKQRIEEMSESRRAEHDEYMAEGDHAPDAMAPGTRIVFADVPTQATPAFQVYLSHDFCVLPPPEEQRQQDHPQQAANDALLRRALETCATRDGWSSFCWSVGLQMLQGLCDMDARGLVHGDLKSSNVGVNVRRRDEFPADMVLPPSRAWVSPCGVVIQLVILDFGSVRAANRPFGAATIPTPRCCPPELLSAVAAKVDDNRKIDIWSLGAIWGSVLCGRSLFFDDTPAIKQNHPWLYRALFPRPHMMLQTTSDDDDVDSAEDEFLPPHVLEARSNAHWIHLLMLHRGLLTRTKNPTPGESELIVLEPDNAEERAIDMIRTQPFLRDVHPDVVRFWLHTLMYHSADRPDAPTLLNHMLAWTNLQRMGDTDGATELVRNATLVLTDLPEARQTRPCTEWSDQLFVRDCFNRLPVLDVWANECDLTSLLSELESLIDGNKMQLLEACLARTCTEQIWLHALAVYANAMHTLEVRPPAECLVADDDTTRPTRVMVLVACIILVLRMVQQNEAWTVSECFGGQDIARQIFLQTLQHSGARIGLPGYTDLIQAASQEAVARRKAASTNEDTTQPLKVRDVERLTQAMMVLWLMAPIEVREELATVTPSLQESVNLAVLVLRSYADASSESDEDGDENEATFELMDDDIQDGSHAAIVSGGDQEDVDMDYARARTIRPDARQAQLLTLLAESIRANETILMRFVRCGFAAQCVNDDNYLELLQTFESLAAERLPSADADE